MEKCALKFHHLFGQVSQKVKYLLSLLSNTAWNQIDDEMNAFLELSKVGNRSRGRPKDSFLNSYYTSV